MTAAVRSKLRNAMLLAGSLAIASLVTMAGCSKDDKKNPVDPGGGGTTTSTSLSGIFVGAGDGGRMTLTIASGSLTSAFRSATRAQDSVNVSGSLDIDPDPASVLPLTGSYNIATDTLNARDTYLSGYTLIGHYDAAGINPAIFGTYSGPNGAGVFESIVGASSTILSFCGTFTNNVNPIGRWNFVLFNGAITGASVLDGGAEVGYLAGGVSGTGNPVAVSFNGSVSGDPLTATGTLDTMTNLAYGTWQRSISGTVVDQGTWSAQLCQ